MTNLTRLRATRKPPEPGDVFVFLLCDGLYTFGQVIDTNIKMAGLTSLILVRVHNCRSRKKTPVPEGALDEPVIDTAVITHHAWTRGYFENVGKLPVNFGPYCFEHYGRYLDKNEEVIPQPVGTVLPSWFGNYRGVEQEVCRLFGIPESPD